MGQCRSTEGWDVRVSHAYDYVHPATGTKKTESLDQSAVHGNILVEDLAHSSSRSAFISRLSFGGHGNRAAEQIVKRAKKMAVAVSGEKDRLHFEWVGPNGQDPLGALFEEESPEEIANCMQELARDLRDLVEDEPTLNRIPAPAKVFGDIHGQFRDMLLFLHNFGYPSGFNATNFVFNGDWVDRGKHQLETVSLVFALKLAYPDRVWLNRGNHEDRSQNHLMGECGFELACAKRFGVELGTEVFGSVTKTFEYLPLGCVVGHRILIVHGGIGNGTWSLDELEDTERPLNINELSQNHMLYNVLWSDPIDEDHQNSFGVHKSPRDGYTNTMQCFGQDITEVFCDRNDLAMIIRSHQALPGGNGYEVMHDAHLVRVFSARDYEYGKQNNDGSILNIFKERGEIVVRPQVLKSLRKKH